MSRYPGIEKVAGGYRIRLRERDPRTGKSVEIDRLRAVSVEEAIRLRAEWRAEIRAGAPAKPTPEPQILSDFIAWWLRVQTPLVRPHTAHHYATVLTRLAQVRPNPGDPPLEKWLIDRIGFEQAQLVVSTLAVGPKALQPRTIRQVVKIARLVWRAAISRKLVTESPWMSVKLPKILKREKPNRLLPGQVDPFLKAAKALFPHTAYPLTALGQPLGMRPGEVRAILWEDVNQETWEISVVRTECRGWTGPTKTDPSNPKKVTIAIDPPYLVDILKAHRQHQIASGWLNPLGLVFPGPQGGHLASGWLSRAYKAICEKAGIVPAVTPHSMRRTPHNVARLAGFSETVIRQVIGHSDAEETKIYSTVEEAEKTRMTGSIIQLFPKKS